VNEKNINRYQKIDIYNTNLCNCTVIKNKFKLSEEKSMPDIIETDDARGIY